MTLVVPPLGERHLSTESVGVDAVDEFGDTVHPLAAHRQYLVQGRLGVEIEHSRRHLVDAVGSAVPSRWNGVRFHEHRTR